TDGAELRRVWRCAGPLDESATADRVRWQLDGWLTGRNAGGAAGGVAGGASRADDDGIDDGGHLDGPDDSGPDARGIVALTLEPLDVIVAGAEHDALWGGADAAAQRAT